MALSNALLIRAAYGWDEAIRATSIVTHGRREALYGLGAYNSAADVARVASARLDVIAEPRYQFDAEHKPTSDTDLAYHGYAVGDTLLLTVPAGGSTSERVLSVSVSEDENTGQATTIPSLHDVVMYASPVENFVAMLSQAVKKMIPGTGRGDWKEAQPVTPPAVPAPLVAWTPPVSPCLTETWPTDNEDAADEDLSWTLDKFSQAFSDNPSYGSDLANVNGPYSGGGHIVGGKFALARPSGVAFPNGLFFPTHTMNFWGHTDCNAILETPIGMTDYTISTTITDAPPTYSPASQDPTGVVGHSGGLRDWGVYLYSRFDDVSFDGWVLTAGNVYDGPNNGYMLLSWQGNSGAHSGFYDGDGITPYTLPTYTGGEVISMTVTGSGASTHVVCKLDGVTILDLSGSTLETANGGDFLDLPAGTKADLYLFEHGSIPAEVFAVHRYYFYGPLSGGTDDTLAVDDFSICPA